MKAAEQHWLQVERINTDDQEIWAPEVCSKGLRVYDMCFAGEMQFNISGLCKLNAVDTYHSARTTVL